MTAHPDADDRDLGDIPVRHQRVEGHRRIPQHGYGAVEIGLRHGERDVRMRTAIGNILDDHIDIDLCIGKRPEDSRRHARAVFDARQRHLRILLRDRDPGNNLFFHYLILADDHRSRHMLETRQHLEAHPAPHRHGNRTRLQHPGALARHLQHFLERDAADLLRARHNPGIAGIDAVHIGIDVAAVRLQGCGQSHGRRVRAAAAERGHPPVGRKPLKARHHGDLSGRGRRTQCVAFDMPDTRPAMRAVGSDGQLPTLEGPRRHAHFLQGKRHQPAGYLLAGRDHRIVLRRVVERRDGCDPTDEIVGDAGHRRNHHRHLVPGRGFGSHTLCGIANSFPVRDRGAAEFQYETRHENP